MYRLRINIDTDGDFYFEKTLFVGEDCENYDTYFENLLDAYQALKDTLETFKDTFYCGSKDLDSIVNWVHWVLVVMDSIFRGDEKVGIVAEKDWGSYSLSFVIEKVEKVEFNNNAFQYKQVDMETLDLADWEVPAMFR